MHRAVMPQPAPRSLAHGVARVDMPRPAHGAARVYAHQRLNRGSLVQGRFRQMPELVSRPRGKPNPRRTRVARAQTHLVGMAPDAMRVARAQTHLVGMAPDAMTVARARRQTGPCLSLAPDGRGRRS